MILIIKINHFHTQCSLIYVCTKERCVYVQVAVITVQIKLFQHALSAAHGHGSQQCRITAHRNGSLSPLWTVH